MHTPICATAVIATARLVLLAGACGLFACDTPKTSACLAGEPRAIFEPTDSTVVSQDFESLGQSSFETVAFGNGLLLALRQSGCDTLVQDFTLVHDSLSVAYGDFLPQASAAFYQLATLAPRLQGFSEYGRLLSSVPATEPEGAPVDLAPGLTVRISGLPTPARPSWRVRFTQDLGGVRGPR